MDFVESTRNYFLKWNDFNSRSPRSEFWWGTLGSFIFASVLGYCIGFIFEILGITYAIVWAILPLQLFLVIAGLALSVRRLHDVNKTGWWCLISVTGVGGFVLLFWYCSKGDEHENKFGSNPLAFSVAVVTNDKIECSTVYNPMSSPIAVDVTIPMTSEKVLMILSGFDSTGSPLKLTIKSSDTLFERGLVIGRSPNFCDLLIKDLQISKAHLHITYEQNLLNIADMNSSNGSKINGNTMPVFVKHTISVGDSLELATINFSASN